MIQQVTGKRIAKGEETHMKKEKISCRKRMIRSPGIECGESCKSVL